MELQEIPGIGEASRRPGTRLQGTHGKTIGFRSLVIESPKLDPASPPKPQKKQSTKRMRRTRGRTALVDEFGDGLNLGQLPTVINVLWRNYLKLPVSHDSKFQVLALNVLWMAIELEVEGGAAGWGRMPVFGCTPVFRVFRGSRWSGMALGIYPAGMDLFANLPPGQSDAVAGNGPGLVTILQEIRRKSHDSEGLLGEDAFVWCSLRT